MDPLLIAAFSDELSKEAGLAGIGKALMKPIAGTKPWVLGRQSQTAQQALRPTGKLKKPVVTRPRRGPGGAYDVSALAAQMGV